MVAGGSNSLVLSAACHCRVSFLPSDDDDEGDGRSQPETPQVDDRGRDTWTQSIDEHVPGDGQTECNLDQSALCGDQSQAGPAWDLRDADDLRDLEDEHSIPMAEDLGRWEERLRKLSQSELKWGAMPLPAHLSEAMGGVSRGPVMHLGFGDESTIIRSPEEGEWYV
ncbi:hypothetical protein F4781DRAFT_436394 [Annulohypoxylon bovei var. microspora]|nr:hypothetical protein F4781DRAFT_436394 [Annulohypoxylon bovei var. microspora]